jgi:hypothetical protein
LKDIEVVVDAESTFYLLHKLGFIMKPSLGMMALNLIGMGVEWIL